MENLVAHNLVTFKSHHESLTPWALKELTHHYVAYRKLVSKTPSDMLPEDQFGLYAVCARMPRELSKLVPWQQVKSGVYDCRWGTDTIRVVVAGELSREGQNAPLHLFSASTELVGFGSSAYVQRSTRASILVTQLIQGFKTEGMVMAYTMEEFMRDFLKKQFARLSDQEKSEVLQTLRPEERVAGLSAEQLHQLAERVAAEQSGQQRQEQPKS